jgi:hypothetical protein
MTQPYPTPSTPRGKRTQTDYQVVPPQQSLGFPPAPPLPSAPAPVKARKWPWIVGIFVAFLLGIGMGGSSDKTPTTSAAGSTVTTQTVTVAAPAPEQNAQPAVVEAPAVAAPAAAAPAASGPKTSFGDGTWVVGEDIQPGTYKTAGATAGVMEFCAVSTHSGDTTDSPIIDIASANANEPIRIKVTGKVKAVKASGCEDFVKVG